MTKYKIQDLRSNLDEAMAETLRKTTSRSSAVNPDMNSMAAVARLLTPRNRRLLAIIRDNKPESVLELSRLSGCRPQNITRTLHQLKAAGFVRTTANGPRRQKVRARIKKLFVEIDPFAERDQLTVAWR